MSYMYFKIVVLITHNFKSLTVRVTKRTFN